MYRIPTAIVTVACASFWSTPGTLAHGQSANDGYGAPVSGLSLRIHPVAPVARKGFVERYHRYSSDVQISVDIKNNSTQPIRFATARAYGLLRVLVRSENGDLLSLPGPVGVADKPRKLDETSLVALDPEQSISDTVTLDALKELPKPGTYQITGVLYAGYLSMFEPSTRKKIQTDQIRVWKGPKAESLPVSFTVN